jgi:hypothetical protein
VKGKEKLDEFLVNTSILCHDIETGSAIVLIFRVVGISETEPSLEPFIVTEFASELDLDLS